MEGEGLKERQRLYERTRDELAAAARSISESYDRGLLTLSSAFLGGSLGFIGQVVELPTATSKWMLHFAWLLFALTIILTLASHVYGLFTLQPLRDTAERYYMTGDEEAKSYSKAVQYRILGFSVAYGVSFFLGIVFLSLFVYMNLERESTMSLSERFERSIPPSTFQKPTSPSPAGTDGGTSQTNPPTPTTQTPPQKQESK